MVRLRSGGPTAHRGDETSPVISPTLSQEDIYLENCKHLGLSPDPGVLISLSTRWFFLETARKNSGACILPLVGVLEENSHVTSLKLNSGKDHGDGNVRALAGILKRNRHIADLNLANSGLTDTGIYEVTRPIALRTKCIELMQC
jgi:hypothetical protein